MKIKYAVILSFVLVLLFSFHQSTRAGTIFIKPAVVKLYQDVSGTVKDTAGNLLSGVSVMLKGVNSKGTTTDANGRFILDVSVQDTLVFSLVGFEKQEVAVNGRSHLDIILQPQASTMDDVVITAFGKATKRTEMVGSVTSVNPADLKVPSSNLTTAFAGRISGMIAFQRSGEPGADNASFFVRGITTFGANTSPLILIDNIELTTTDLAQLQTDDIESFSIMKDAAATALYGARGANGVILVTTKKGKIGKISTTVRLENSVSSPTTSMELADPVTYMKLNNEAIVTREPLASLLYSQEKINNTVPGSGSYLFPATNWNQELLKEYATTQRANISVSGGGALATYYITGSYSHDNGILKADERNSFKSNINSNIFTLRSNITLKPISTMEITTRFSGNFTDYSGPLHTGTEMYSLIMRSNPVLFPAYYPVDAEHEKIQHILFGNAISPGNSYYINPYAELVKGFREYGRSNLSAQLQINQQFDFLTKGLSARALLNIYRITSYATNRSYSPFWYGLGSYDRLNNTYSIYNLNPNEGTDYLDFNSSIGLPTANLYFEGALNYSRVFSAKHSVSSMLVYQLRNNVSTGASTVQESLPYRNIGLSGRATYGYDNRYMAEFNFGYNGSERFHPRNQFGFFPSAGVAWNISNEKWFENMGLHDVIRLFKLRATYGVVGNDNIGSGRFMYLSEINMDNSGIAQYFGLERGYTNGGGISVTRYSDTDITWEIAKKQNYGMEIELRNGLSFIAEYYQEKRSDILMTRSNIPATMGLWVTPSSNVGEASAKGVDLSLKLDKKLGRNSWLQLIGNFTYARGVYDVYDELHYDKEWWLSKVGYSINQNWGYIAERLFIDDNEVANSPTQFGTYMAGDIKYRDVNNDGQITALDKVPIGYPTSPEIIYGFGGSFGYKNFDISVFFQGLGRESFWIDYNNTSPFFSNNEGSLYGTNQLAKFIADSYWNEDSRDIYAIWPRLSTSSIDNNDQVNTWFMRNGSFLRLKSAELGYTLPVRVSQRAGLKKARIYLNGTNLLTWSKFKLWDVEQGASAFNYPIQRVYNIGLLLNF